MPVRTLVVSMALIMCFLVGCASRGIEVVAHRVHRAQLAEPVAAVPLRFDVREGRWPDVFVRHERTAAHLLLRSAIGHE